MTGEAAPATQEEQDHAAEAHDALQEGADALAKAKAAGKVNVPPLEGYVGFVAPVEQNTRILANPDPVDNKVIQLRDQNSATGLRDTQRTNDVWVEFVNGSFVTNDPAAIAWCRAHPKICRDVSDPQTGTWYMMRLAQIPLAARGASLPPETDVDAALAGDLTKLGSEPDPVTQTRAFADQANEREPVEA